MTAERQPTTARQRGNKKIAEQRAEQGWAATAALLRVAASVFGAS